MSGRKLVVEVVETHSAAHDAQGKAQGLAQTRQAAHAADVPTEHLFAHSPVRVGRSLLNDLALDYSFVSHCHGMFYFTEDRVEFVDVGSTNGSFVGGMRTAVNQRIQLSCPATVTLGALPLTVRLESRLESIAKVPSDVPSSQLCERFARSFLELRRGQQQLLGALGLPPRTGGELQALDTPHALLSYLLDPAATSERIDELSRAHADLMRHEVALVSALAAGARELVDELSPKNLAPPGVGGIVGWLRRLFGHDERWATLERKVDELREDSALSAVVMGRSFARAYAAALHTQGRLEASSARSLEGSLGPSRARFARPLHEDDST